MPFINQGPEGEQAPYGASKTNWKFLLIILILAVIVGVGILLVSKKEISTIQIVLPKTQKEISEQKVLELENQILESKFGSKITEFTIIKKITTPNLDSCPGIENYTKDKIWFSEGFPDIKGFRDYAIEGFVGINGEFVCLYANRRGAGSGNPPLIPLDSFYDQVTTAGWKTYKNEEYGYDVKYYKDWAYKEAGPYTYFFPEVYEGIQLAAIQAQVFIWNENLNQPKEGRKLNMEEHLCAAKCPPEIIYSVSNKENSKIAILRLTVQEEVCGHMECVEQRSAYPLSDSGIENIIHQMLSTFMFIEEFCGTSTYGSCTIDSDCIAGGCSGQVCQSKNEEPIVTTCEYKDCYNAQSYGLDCKCVDKKCQWAK